MKKLEYYSYSKEDLDSSSWWWSIFCYGWFFSLVPFLIYSNRNKFIYHHARQGVVQFVLIIVSLLFLIIPTFGELLFLVYLMLNCSISIMGIILYNKNLIYEFPVIGFFAKKIKVSKFD